MGKKYKIQILKGRSDSMGAVLSLQNHINKEENRIRTYSIIDMILDPQKRKESLDYYNAKYEETDEEKDIFEAWQEQYKKGDE